MLATTLDFAKQDYDLDSLVLEKVHRACNRGMRDDTEVEDESSGTTAISVHLRGDVPKVTVSWVGDSRAILGSCKENSDDPTSLVATGLSVDQTPWRQDERVRIEKAGGRVLNEDQLLGRAPIIPVSDKNLGEEIDGSGLPPRVFSPHGPWPGLAVTRSMGDRSTVDENFGIISDPETMTHQLSKKDKIIFLASDGVWEFITNQEVIDICTRVGDPLKACREIQAKSCKLWLQNDTRTDDITMICIFIDDVQTGAGNATQE